MTQISAKEIFEKDIFEILGMQNLDEKTKNNLRIKFLDAVSDNVHLRVIDNLNDSQTKEWEKLLDEGDNDKIKEFLSVNKIPTNKYIVEETLQYKNKLTDFVSKCKE